MADEVMPRVPYACLTTHVTSGTCSHDLMSEIMSHRNRQAMPVAIVDCLLANTGLISSCGVRQRLRVPSTTRSLSSRRQDLRSVYRVRLASRQTWVDEANG